MEEVRRGIKQVFAICLLTVALCDLVTAAEPEYNQAGEVNYSVKAIIPDNQIDKRQSYFDLQMEPGQEQMLQMRVYNNGASPLTVEVSLNTASTNPGGVLDYSRPDIRDESMAIAISEIAHIEERQLTIPPRESRVVPIIIKMPDEQFDGVLLGGIRIKKVGEEEAPQMMEGGSAGIINEYVYVTAVQIRETDVVVEPDLTLRKVEPGLANFRTAVVATVANEAAAVAKNVDFTAKVYKAEGTEILQEMAQNDVDMAPNSVFEFAIDWNNNRIQPGDYRLHLKAEQGERIWEWDEKFTVEGAKAGEVNNKAVNIQSAWFNRRAVLLAAGVAAMLLLFFIIYLAARKRRKATET